MPQFEEQPKFEIQPIIEQRPFENPAVQSFFAKWCEINDSIVPEVVDRETWAQKVSTNLLQKQKNSKQTLYIPEDLQLWEMVGVMEAVDHDTFANKPERQNEAKEKILELGYMLQDAGVYIGQRLNSIQEGREIAGALAEEFYNYGQSLVTGEKPKQPSSIDDISQEELTGAETEAVDRFLAGDNLYESRRTRADDSTAIDPDKKNEVYEEERQKTLAQFFRASEKAFELEGKSENGELRESGALLQPWQNDAPIHSLFLDKVRKAMTQKIEMPKTELDSAIFRRGMEKLVGEMKERGWKYCVNSLFEKLGIDLHIEQKKLADALHIEDLKAELQTVRQSEDVVKISMKEREIADKIQRAVSKFPFLSGANNPSQMIETQFINCVGASTLGGALMNEAGLNYLVGDVPAHSITVLTTADGKIYWQDMSGAVFNGKEIKDGDIRGMNGDNNPPTVKDIADFSHNPREGSLQMEIPSFWYRLNMGQLKKFSNPHLTVHLPESGQQIQILNNTGDVLADLDLNHEACVAYRQAIALNPKYAPPYYGLGRALSDIGRDNEAIETYRQAIALDPKYAASYYGLGIALSDIGRKEEAVGAYKKFIELADKQKDAHWIKRAEIIINELQNKKHAVA